MAYNKNLLPDYVEQNKSELMSATILSPKSIDNFSMMSGVHSATTLNNFANDLVFQDGKSCGFTPEGDTTFSQRTINPGIIKINMEWCDKDLIDKYMTHEVMIGANRTTMPFEEKICSDIVTKVSNELEKLLWQGDKAAGTGNMAFTDGLVKLCNADQALINNVTFDADDTIIDKINKVYMAIPEEVLDKAVIYVSPAQFREYAMQCTALNLYHYTTEMDPSRELIIPGTDTKIRMAITVSIRAKIIATSNFGLAMTMMFTD